MRVLLVDDEPLELEQLQFLIQDKYPAWQIWTADDGVQAKKILAKHSIDLALLDIHLPGETGLELGFFIKKNYKTECIMVTAYEDFHYAQEAIRMNVFDYIVKPVIKTEFYETMERFKEKNGHLNRVSPLIQQVIDIIQQQYRSKLNLTEIAQSVHVSSSYLSRKFAEELGMTFQEYLVSYRIKRAKQLLKENPFWSIQQVADEAGFTSLHHFSYTFKKLVQVTPRRFKENIQHD
ncbi:response regulator [Niallia sp. NCCP-28]|uniref:response regulator transcription factor n=1 Tax=Niallia sp. NCCP-28 TaxID=2934712 RepID=UPI0020847646|nr:helix-turn-helix domain-containing protein [Niallia sp. NCCP-28]GKU81947.1 DNA-binding response regulator [Niallia sp. NCCP-28]